jgi:hypothetical protein
MFASGPSNLEEIPKAAEYFLPVTARPEDALAGGAGEKSEPSLEDVGGDPFGHRLFGRLLQAIVALDASRQQRQVEGIVSRQLQDFAQLGAQTDTLDEQPPAQGAAPDQAAVPRESDAILPDAQLNQLGVFYGPPVGRIVAEDPQPAGQASQHDVGEESKLGVAQR